MRQATTAQVESQLLPGFRTLGLDPAQVKVILVTHGHADHFGGASYFPEHFRLEGLRVRGGLEPDGEPSGSRARWARTGRPADAAPETRRRNQGRRADRPGRLQNHAGGRPGPYAWFDGIHLPGEGSGDASHRGAVRRRVADAANPQR